MTVRLETLTAGPALERLLGPLADLRIEVFRDWPYLYDGDRDYEAWYLAKFAAADGAVLVAAFHGDDLVGASTGLPLAAEHADLTAPLAATGHSVAHLYYGAETILRRRFRGRGLYRRFFERREAHATGLGTFGHLVFCGVVRPDDHPLKPAEAAPLDPVWRRFGYRRMDGVTAGFPWKDIDQPTETTKPMQFWIKRLQVRQPGHP